MAFGLELGAKGGDAQATATAGADVVNVGGFNPPAFASGQNKLIALALVAVGVVVAIKLMRE